MTEVVVPLTKAKATALDKKIRAEAAKARTAVEQVSILLEEAQAGKVHVTLGFKSWPAYVKDVLSGQVSVGTEKRRVLVALMHGEGMSQKAIGEALGIHKSTVSRQLDGLQNATPDGASTSDDAESPKSEAQEVGQISPPDKPLTSANAESPKSEAQQGDRNDHPETPAVTETKQDYTIGLDGKKYPRKATTPKPTKEEKAEAASKIRKELADAGVVAKAPAEPRDKSTLEIMVEVGIEAAERLDELNIILEVATELEGRVQEVVDCQDHRGEEELELIKQISTKLIDITCSLATLAPQESESKS